MNTIISREEKIQDIKKFLSKTYIDPSVTKDTIGEGVSNVSARALLLASSKLISINKKESEPDDRDSLKFSTFLGFEDFIQDHIIKDAGGFRKKAAMKIQQKKNLSWLHPSFFTNQVKSTVIGNSLTNNVEGINPIEHFDNSHRLTKLGEGGIQSTQGIPATSRQVNESSFGFFDPLHIAESTGIGITQYIAANTIKGKDNKLYKLVKNSKTGKKEWIDHETLLNSKVAVPDI